jgi:acyl-homoserine-lactone acylase
VDLQATLDSLIAVAYDGYLTAFDVLLPPLLKAYDSLGADDALRSRLQEPISLLRNWNHGTSVSSRRLTPPRMLR